VDNELEMTTPKFKAVIYCTWVEDGKSQVRYVEESASGEKPAYCKLPEMYLGNVTHQDVMDHLTRNGSTEIVWFDTEEFKTNAPIRVYAVNSKMRKTIQTRGAEYAGDTNALWDLAWEGGSDMSLATQKIMGQINFLHVLEQIGVNPRPSQNMVSVKISTTVHSLESSGGSRGDEPLGGKRQRINTLYTLERLLDVLDKIALH